MTRTELLCVLNEEIALHPGPELFDVQKAVSGVSDGTFRQLWQSLPSEKTVTWKELTHMIHQFSLPIKHTPEG
jgi:hypothetical protein